MSKRNPSGPVPGFEDEFYGTVGHEKRVHRTHWHFPGVKIKNNIDTGREWVFVGQKWKLLPKKAQERGYEPEVDK